jgi:hypothetical protein
MFEAGPFSKLGGTLLRQTQNNTVQLWEPYVLFFQTPDFAMTQLTRTSTGWARSWDHDLAYQGSPVALVANENGYGLELFYLRANDSQLQRWPAPSNTSYKVLNNGNLLGFWSAA